MGKSDAGLYSSSYETRQVIPSPDMQQNRLSGSPAPRRFAFVPGAALGGGISVSAVTALLRSPSGIRHVVVVVALVVVGVMAWRTIDYRLDEGLVYARYAQNFADGHGLVFNTGESRNATASYLYALLLVPFALAGFDVPLAANVLGAVAVAATCLLLAYLIIPPRDWIAGLAGGAAGAGYGLSAVNFASLGVEMPIALLCATAALCAVKADRLLAAGVCCGLAAAIRPEFIVFGLAVVLVTGVARRAFPAVLGVSFLAVLAPFAVFSAAYYGELLPQAIPAYAALGRSGLYGDTPVYLLGARDVLDTLGAGGSFVITFATLSVLVLGATTLALRSRRQDGGPRDPQVVLGWTLTVFALAWITLFSFMEMPAFHWQVAPLIWAAVVAVPVVASSGSRQALFLNPRSRPFVTVFVSVALLALAVSLAARLDNPPRDRNEVDVAIAHWLDANGGESCSVGAAQVGHLAWYSKCTTVDEVGVVTAGNSGPLERGDFDAWLARANPRYVVTFSPLAPYEHGVLKAVLAGEYAPVGGVLFPGRFLFEKTGRAPNATGWLLGTNIGEGAPGLNENLYAVGGVFRPALFMHVSQTHDILVPGTGVTFEAYLGIADGAERSKGVTFILRADGREVERKVVKPGAWERLTVTLPARADGPLTLTLETDTAPGGTSNFGWAVWGEPRIIGSP